MIDKGGVSYSYRPDAHFPDVTRITVVSDEHGRAFERYGMYKNGVDIIIQDDGRTLKIFPAMKMEVFNEPED